MDNKEEMKKEKNEKAKETFSTFWKKTTDFSKKAAEGAKTFAEQTKKNIHDQQAKKYTAVTSEEFKDENFKLPRIIEIVDNSANREFIFDEDAIGWIEKHKDIDVLHIYFDFVKSSNLIFVPVPQIGRVYFGDNFDSSKFIDTNGVFGKATEEKLAELEHIANYLGAKCCSIEIVEKDFQVDSRSIGASKSEMERKTSLDKKQSGKTVSYFQGSDTPRKPNLKWFAHDDNIIRLIEMRCTENNAIKSKMIELKGSTSATMSQKIACAIDDILNIKGALSMERQTIREHSNTLIFEIEF